MAGLREIQNRIRSIQDTRKITNAMYLISSTKLKKSQKRTGRDGAVFLCIAKCHPAYPEASAEHGKSLF
ncbi:MAG: F0F1 ATP synthase subunit gamma [Clostridium fessum]